MLLYFKVSNFRSIDKEVELSMIAAEYDDLKENTIPIENYGVSVVKTAMLYGANASGKSNLLKAIILGKTLVLDSYKYSKENPLPYFPNKNDSENLGKPTGYLYSFLWNDTHYEYSFSNTHERILEEKLVSITADESQTLHYHRQFNTQTKDYDWSFDRELESKKEFLLAITNQKKLLISVISQLETNYKEFEVLKSSYDFFLNFQTHEANRIDSLISVFKTEYQKPESALKILDLLESADLPIMNLGYVQVEKEFEQNKETTFQFLTFHKNSIGEPTQFDFIFEESNGTQRFVSLLAPLLKTIAENQILVIDELENSMHPMLAEYLIEYFHKHSKKAQLIFSSHDTSLMNLQKVRLDQIYVTNANEQRNTEIEPLSNYEIDKDRRLGNVYLQGILGGVPLIKRNFK